MATSKALRAPPPRILEKYVASIRRLRDAEPQTEADKNFVNFVDDGISSFGISDIFNHDIGFGFEINGITYKKFAVYPGFVLLQDPAATPAISDFNSSIFTYSNGTIKTNFTNNHVLLCPWYDAQEYISSTAKNLSLATSYNSTVTPAVLNNIKEGRDSQAWPFDHIDHGIRYKNTNSARYGKCLLVRFSCFVTNDTKPNRLKYEVAIFENGRIEFRYWPRITYKKGDTLSTNLGNATCGIFWSGPSFGSNKFRDFAPLLDYKKDKRVLSEFGASEYQAGYTESGVPYANLIKNVNWPTGGGIITFSPPVNQAKFLPKSVVKNISSRAIEPQPGVFDDRKTITYKSITEVHMPSALSSRLLGDTGDVDVSLRQQLILPNGFKTTGNVKSSVIENLISQLDASEQASELASDSHFNETKYNYSTTSFYATGSSSEYSGLGFDAPLQSQVQFNFSLPVNKPVTMLANTASLYYYDNRKKQWTLITTGSDPSKAAEGLQVWGDEVAKDNLLGYFRVTESAVGFDAVGRKVVSGSSPFNGDYPKQSVWDPTFSTLSGETIGAKVNLPKGIYNNVRRGPFTLNEMPGVSHDASMTDNPAQYPAKDQLIDLQSDFPFLIQKIVVDVPLFASGTWFEDFTTCKRPWSTNQVSYPGPVNFPAYIGYNVGPVDFGGPALTFSLFCARKGEAKSYVDIIASGTITHNFDNVTGSLIEKNNATGSPVYYSVRPVGFKNFSNPTAVISGTWNGSTHTYSGKVRLEMHASHATGITFARNDVWQKHPELADTINASLSRFALLNLLRSPNLVYADNQHSNKQYFEMTGSRVYVQQVCPYARGTSRFESSGNSTLLGPFVPFSIEESVKNPLYTENVNTSLVSTVGANNWDGTTILSTVDSKVSPYLILPGDKIGISMSKVRPVLEKCSYLGLAGSSGFGYFYNAFGNYVLTGSHHGVVLNTGSIDITIYGSYVSQGMGYIP